MNTMSCSRGSSRSRFFRLCSRAPLMTILSVATRPRLASTPHRQRFGRCGTAIVVSPYDVNHGRVIQRRATSADRRLVRRRRYSPGAMPIGQDTNWVSVGNWVIVRTQPSHVRSPALAIARAFLAEGKWFGGDDVERLPCLPCQSPVANKRCRTGFVSPRTPQTRHTPRRLQGREVSRCLGSSVRRSPGARHPEEGDRRCPRLPS